VELTEIHRLKTPWQEEQLTVDIDGNPIRCVVTCVRKSPPKSRGTSVETVDDVDALEA